MYVAPDGSPDVEKETLCAVPDTSVAVMALVTDDPGVTDLAPPFEREKSKVVDTVPTVTVLLVVMAL